MGHETERYGIEAFAQSRIPNLTPDRKAQIQVAFYIRLLNAFDKSCKTYQHQRIKQNKALLAFYPEGKYEGRTLDYYEDGRGIRDLGVMEEIFLAMVQGAVSLTEVEARWGAEGRVYHGLIEELLPKIEQSKENILQETQKWNPRKTFKLAIDAASVFPSLSEEQRARMLVLAGYNPEEITKLGIRLGLSTALSISLGQAYEYIGIGSAALGGVLRFNNSLGVVLASYAMYYGVMLANAEINLRLLKNKDIATSPNITATAAYYLLDRILPQGEKLKNRDQILDWTTRAASLLMEPVKEIGWAGTILIPEVGMSMITAANIAGFSLNALQAIYAKDMVKPENQIRIQHFLGGVKEFIQHPINKAKQMLSR